MVAIAITRLAKHGGSISLFVRHVKNYFAFYSPIRTLAARTATDGNACDRRDRPTPEAVLSRSILKVYGVSIGDENQHSHY